MSLHWCGSDASTHALTNTPRQRSVCAQTSASPMYTNGKVSAHLHTETLSEITRRNRCDPRMIGIIREGGREGGGGRERREERKARRVRN